MAMAEMKPVNWHFRTSISGFCITCIRECCPLFRQVTPPIRCLYLTQGLPSAGKEKGLTHQEGRMRDSNVSVNSSTLNRNTMDPSEEVFLHSALAVVLKEALAETIADIETSF
ncbi:hypothetical protein KC19_9G030100 [Ceratodon purpureus]|uniref:Uncharacterized protein n=1 Tax=Ceratodon purpureus TaxID=3225 RepID=A0A8T0GTM6_CERPU|nr:hypothetical protein KC19_9G030100 [Ceratodon purpureus]